MPLELFPSFSNFPSEIQQLIWDTAVRPVSGQRHVQFFIIEDQGTKPANPTHPVQGDFLRLGPEGRINSGFKLAVPRQDALNGANKSAYLSDSGLWMACRDSRAAMERYYAHNEWWSDMPGSGNPSRAAKPGDYHQQSRASHTSSYVDNDGCVRHITFRPADDLFYFSPLKLDEVNWWHHYAFEEVPLIDGDRSLSVGRSFLGPNVAITYDPMMISVLRDSTRYQCEHTWSGESEMALIDAVGLFHECVKWTMWFVDYRLRRAVVNDSAVHEVPVLLADGDADTNSDHQVFYTENCVFREVKYADMPGWVVKSDGDEDVETVFDFFNLLREKYSGRLEVNTSTRMRVLACEVKPGKSLTPWPQTAKNAPCEACIAKRILEAAPKRIRNAIVANEDEDEDCIDWETFSLFD